jgi:uroporphyrinogen decarboxylase
MSDTLKVPLANPAPDYQRLLRAVTTDYEPPRPPAVEYIVDPAVMRPVLERVGRRWVQPGEDRDSQTAYWDNYIAFWHHMGYDYVRLELALARPRPERPGGIRGRSFVESGRGAIGSWEDFDSYPWPRAEEVDFFPYEHIAAHMPEGMGLMASHGGGVFEHLNFLMGYETLCLSLYDDPELVAAVADLLGALMVDYYRRLLKVDRLIAIWPGDDMGFRSGTLISPDDLRKYTLPWHKKFAEMTHQAGLPYFLHSCGNLAAVMDDLIDDVGIDAKHSFEDAITPAGQFKRRYGDRIGTLGGVDVDVLTRRDPQTIRSHVRELIDQCAPGGRFAVGSGNSIPDYIPVENYLTMMDEALR